jgi:hypothetical protein
MYQFDLPPSPQASSNTLSEPISRHGSLSPLGKSGKSPYELLRRFKRLTLRKQRGLILLALLGIAAIIVSIVFFFLIDDPSQSDKVSVPSLSGSANIFPVATPEGVFTGTFAVTNNTQMGPVQLELRQYGNNITGTQVGVTCNSENPQMLSSVITGYLLKNNMLSLTISSPEKNQSQITVYSFSLTTVPLGFTLSWRDNQGHQQFQRWTPSQPGQFNIAAIAFCHGG